MSDFDGESGAVENEKNVHYVGIKKGWEYENNKTMNEGMKYNEMADLANVAHPPTQMQGEKRNSQIMGNGSGDNNYNYNSNRGK